MGALNAFMFITLMKKEIGIFFTVKENEMQYVYVVFFHKTNLSSQPEQETSFKQREWFITVF